VAVCYTFCAATRTVNLTKLRISIVEYLNTAPLVWGFTHGPLCGKYQLSFTVPSQCAEALRTGAVDLAIIPAIEYQTIPDLVVLPDLAIASKRQVRSLLLVSKKPVGEVRSIALDSSSRSTQALTRILCADHWHIAPQFFEAAPNLSDMLYQADAALLIGDPALRLSVDTGPSSWLSKDGEALSSGTAAGVTGVDELYFYDMVGEWRRTTGLPAVLAVWAGRPTMVTPEVAADFAASRDYGIARIPEIASEAARDLGMPQAALEAYLRENIDFSLDEENRRGLELYYAKASAIGLIAKPRPVVWANAVADHVVAKS
jgi:chorismate dehydratase